MLPYFLNTHIQVFRFSDRPYYNFYHYFIPFYEWDCFEYQLLKWDFIFENALGPESLISRAIDASYYVFLCLDEYYTEPRSAYHTFHNNHNMLIFGYDEWIFGVDAFRRLVEDVLQRAFWT